MASLRSVRSREAAGPEILRSGRLAYSGIDERRQIPAAAGVHEAGEIADERRVDPFAALVRRDTSQLEKLVDIGLG